MDQILCAATITELLHVLVYQTTSVDPLIVVQNVQLTLNVLEILLVLTKSAVIHAQAHVVYTQHVTL